MIFVGQHPYQMDDRNRVPIPPAYRAAFKPGYVAHGLEAFLVLHTEESLVKSAEAVDPDTSESEYGENVRRDLFANASQVMPDGQGRITLEKRLIDHARLSKDVMVVGTGIRMEIWDRGLWEAHEAERKEARREAMNKRGGG